VLGNSIGVDALALEFLEILLALFALLRGQEFLEQTQIRSVVDGQARVCFPGWLYHRASQVVFTHLDTSK